MNIEIIKFDFDGNEADIMVKSSVGNFICYGYDIDTPNIKIENLKFSAFMPVNFQKSEDK